MVAGGARAAGGCLMAASGMEISERTVTVWGGRLDLTVQVAGQGPPLVYLHSAAGLAWDPFLERLASDYTIYAPQVPGTTPGKPDAIRELDDLWDLVLVYEETIRRLGLGIARGSGRNAVHRPDRRGGSRGDGAAG